MGAGASTQGQYDLGTHGIGGLTGSSKEQTPGGGTSSSLQATSKQDRAGSDPVKDARWCASVKRYVDQQYGTEIRASLATAGSNDDKQAETFATLAKNYVGFWLEAADLEDCPESAFRALRTDDMCERYFRIGGKSKIPFNKLVVEEVLMARDSESVLPKDVFAKAMVEAKEYIEAEVLPFFYSSSSKLGFRTFKQHSGTVRDRRGSTGSLTGLNELDANDVLVDWLEDDPKHPFEFRAFLAASSQPELVSFLDFLLESHDFAMLYVAGDTEAMEEESAVLVHFNDLFDRFILLGNDVRCDLPTDLVSELFRKACNDEDVDGAILDRVRIFAQSALLDQFARHRRQQSDSLLHSTMRALELVAADRGDASEMERVEAVLKIESTCRDFQSYVAAHEPAHVSNAVQFCVATMEFEKMVTEARQAHVENVAINQSQALKIFGEFLRHRAPKEMTAITGEARRALLREARSPHATMFADCQELVIRAIASSGARARFVALGGANGGGGGRVKPVMTRVDSDEDDEHEVPLGLILRRHEFCRTFKKWAEQEFLLVPILFWFETNEFLRLPRADLLLSRCRKIMRMYVVENAPRRFVLPPDLIASIAKSTSIPGPGMFVDAQREAFKFMDAQMMPRFRKTGQYKLIRMSFMVDDLESGMLGGIGAPSVSSKEGSSAPRAEDMGEGRNDPTAFSNTEVPNTMVSPTMPLKNCLRNPLATRFFLDFCTTNHYGETVMFWIEANDFKAHVPGKRFMALQARKIYNKYMGDGAKMKVKLSAEVQQTVLQGLQDPQKTLFHEAQEEAYNYLTSEIYPAFKESTQFDELLELARYETVWDTIKRRMSGLIDPSTYRRGSAFGTKGHNIHASFALPWSTGPTPRTPDIAANADASPALSPTSIRSERTSLIDTLSNLRSHLTPSNSPMAGTGPPRSGSFGKGSYGQGAAAGPLNSTNGGKRLTLTRVPDGAPPAAGT